MPETLTESVLLAIVVAAPVQTIVVGAACVATWITMRRLQASRTAESAELHLRLDEALVRDGFPGIRLTFQRKDDRDASHRT